MYSSENKGGFAPRRQTNPKWRIKHLNIDVSEMLVAAVADIAKERGVSLYGQIRDFIEEGVRNYQFDKEHGIEPLPCKATSFRPCSGRTQSFGPATWSPLP